MWLENPLNVRNPARLSDKMKDGKWIKVLTCIKPSVFVAHIIMLLWFM